MGLGMITRRSLIFVLGLSGGLTSGWMTASSRAVAQVAGKTMTTASGLKIADSKIGTGATPKPGQTCVMHYTGWLYEGEAKGRKLDSSLDRGQPFEFPIGKQRVIMLIVDPTRNELLEHRGYV